VYWTRVATVAAVACLVGGVGCVGCGIGGSAPVSAPGLAAAPAGGTGSPGHGVARPGGRLTGAANDGTTGYWPTGNGTASPGPGSTGLDSTGLDSTGPLRAPWPERGILPQDNTLGNASQVLDLPAGVLYVLVPTSQQSQWAPLTLEAIDLRTGKVRHGRSYPDNGLVLASGYLWVYGISGPHGHPVLDEVDPKTLDTVRTVPMPAVSDADGVAAVAAGPAGSVWAAVGTTLLRLSVRTGTVLARAILPDGPNLINLTLGSYGMDLYAGAGRLKPGGAIVLKYSASTGALLGQADGAPLTWAISGVGLTAGPGGVWVSLRTGMLGESELLSARTLAVISGPPALNPAVRGNGTIYGWVMGESSAYAGGALWVATDGGVVACVNPETGRVRAEETVPSQQGAAVFALAADGAARQVDAVVSNSTGFSGVVTISPPRTCWR
jgi:hypothetical protein